MKYSTTIFILSSKLQILRLIKLSPFQAFKKKITYANFPPRQEFIEFLQGENLLN